MQSPCICATALAEAYGMTQDENLKVPAQMGMKYILEAQHPSSGGWLYTPRAGGDTSVSGWQIMALRACTYAHILVPDRDKALASKWLDTVQWDVPTSSAVGAAYGYRKAKDRPTVSPMSAVGLTCRTYLGTGKDDPGLKVGIRRLADAASSPANLYYNYYAAMALHQLDAPDGLQWNKWNSIMRDHLIRTQLKDGKEVGSWYLTAKGAQDGAKAGGRVYCTAMSALILETYYRYPAESE